MITFRTIADVPADRQVVVTLPSETPIGKAELVVTVAPQEKGAPPTGNLRELFGTINSGNPSSADNDAIDADLAQIFSHDS